MTKRTFRTFCVS